MVAIPPIPRAFKDARILFSDENLALCAFLDCKVVSALVGASVGASVAVFCNISNNPFSNSSVSSCTFFDCAGYFCQSDD